MDSLCFAGKSFVCGPVGHVVFAMGVQKNGAEQEVEAANDNAYSATGDVHVVVGAVRVQAVRFTLLVLANHIGGLRQENHQALNVKESREHNLDPNGKQEKQERVVIFDSDAVVDPWAMMVESLDALVADCTMPASC